MNPPQHHPRTGSDKEMRRVLLIEFLSSRGCMRGSLKNWVAFYVGLGGGVMKKREKRFFEKERAFQNYST